MPVRLKKLIGTVLLVALIAVYAIVATIVAVAWLGQYGGFIHFAYFLVTGGLGWALVHHGAGPIGLVYASGTGMLIAALLNGGRFWRLSRRFHRQS